MMRSFSRVIVAACFSFAGHAALAQGVPAAAADAAAPGSQALQALQALQRAEPGDAARVGAGGSEAADYGAQLGSIVESGHREPRGPGSLYFGI